MWTYNMIFIYCRKKVNISVLLSADIRWESSSYWFAENSKRATEMCSPLFITCYSVYYAQFTAIIFGRAQRTGGASLFRRNSASPCAAVSVWTNLRYCQKREQSDLPIFVWILLYDRNIMRFYSENTAVAKEIATQTNLAPAFQRPPPPQLLFLH